MAIAWSHKLENPKIYPLDQVDLVQKVCFNSIKKEQRYYEFKLDVHIQTSDRKIDVVLEMTSQEVGHLKL